MTSLTGECSPPISVMGGDERCERVPGTLYLKSALWVGGYCDEMHAPCGWRDSCADLVWGAVERQVKAMRASANYAARMGHRLSAQMQADEAARIEAQMHLCAGGER